MAGVKKNYQRELEKIIDRHQKAGEVPTLLLHSCCGPCSTYVLEYLSEFFKITVFYYNPNLYPDEEYIKRVEEQKRFIKQLPVKNKISFIEGDFEKEAFYEAVKGLENLSEGGERCFVCYRMRLKKTMEKACALGFDYFTTTLSISPMKDSGVLNDIGLRLADEAEVDYLVSDFKKKNGYKRSVELSKEYNMYRQNYCGCVFSIKE